MKNSIESRTSVRKDKNSDWEIRQIQILNADENPGFRSYPEIDYLPRATRTPILGRALSMWPNRFALCGATVKIARIIHDPRNVRVAHSINKAMAMVLRPARRKPRPITSLPILIPRPQPSAEDSSVATQTAVPAQILLVHGEAI